MNQIKNHHDRSFVIDGASEDSNVLRPEQLAELAEFFSHTVYANQGEEFLNDAIRMEDQYFDMEDELF